MYIIGHTSLKDLLLIIGTSVSFQGADILRSEYRKATSISSSLIRDWTGCGFGFVMLKYWCKIKPMIRVIVSGEVPFGEKSIET